MDLAAVGPNLRAEFWQSNGWVLVVVSSAWMLTVGVRIVYPALLPEIQSEFGFDYTLLGFLVSTLWLGYAAMQLPGGVIADVWSHRGALVVGAFGTGVCILLVVGAQTLLLFMLATALLGGATGVLGPSRVAVLSHVFTDAKSTAIGISQAAGNVGNATLPIAAGLVAAIVGWRGGLGILIPMLFVVGIALWVVVPNITVGTKESVHPPIWELVAGDQMVRIGSAVLLLTSIMIVFQGVSGFLPTFFIDAKGLSRTVTTTLFGAFFAAGVIMQLLAGPVADWYGTRIAVAGFATLGMVGFMIVVIGTWWPVLFLGVVLASGSLGCMPPALAYSVSVVPPGLAGTGLGVIRTMYLGLGATGPLLIGIFADTVSLTGGMLIPVGILGLLSGTLLIIHYLRLPSIGKEAG